MESNVKANAQSRCARSRVLPTILTILAALVTVFHAVGRRRHIADMWRHRMNSIAVIIALAVFAIATVAQTPPTQKQQFEVASVKLNKSGGPPGRLGTWAMFSSRKTTRSYWSSKGHMRFLPVMAEIWPTSLVPNISVAAVRGTAATNIRTDSATRTESGAVFFGLCRLRTWK